MDIHCQPQCLQLVIEQGGDFLTRPHSSAFEHSNLIHPSVPVSPDVLVAVINSRASSFPGSAWIEMAQLSGIKGNVKRSVKNDNLIDLMDVDKRYKGNDISGTSVDGEENT